MRYIMPPRDNIQSGSMSPVSEAIRLGFDGLTGAQRALAEYVLGHADDVAFMAARQLGEATGSSDAAVIRFAQALGFRGFLEMRASLREELLERAGSIGVAAKAGAEKVGTPTLVNEVFQLDQTLIQQTELLNAPALYDSIARRLIQARRVWITAHGTSYPMAAYLAMLLNQALSQARVLTIAEGDLAGELRDLGAEDAVVGIGYVRYLPYTVELLRLARLRQAAVFAITDKPTSPLARLADSVLLVARDGISFAVSQSGTMTVAHALIASVARRIPNQLRDRLRDSDQLWHDLGHWTHAESPRPTAFQPDRKRRSKRTT
jgi:DNA-binding MurR/RpiR family transcriptional regulator